MYSEYWKLKELPFDNIPNPRFVYYSPNHDEALMRLFYTVRGRKGACMLTGDIGCGKTTICQVFQDRLMEGDYEVVLITNPTITSKELLQEILYQLGLEFENSAMKRELIRAMNDRVLQNMKVEKETVLIIDEAHLIKDKETYEELRLLLNLQDKERFLISLILVGQPELKKLIAKVPQLQQRIPIRYHLKPLNFVDTAGYIQFRLRKAGIKKDIFTEGAVKSIFKYSSGIPRKINNICDMSLLVGFIDQVKKINNSVIKKAIADGE